MERNQAIDGVRGCAIIMVIIYHYFTWLVQPVHGSLAAYIQLPSMVFWSGVDLFFVLSGFLIGRILILRSSSRNYYRVFYLRRAFRILPLYLLLVLLLASLRYYQPVGLEPLYGGQTSLWAYVGFMQNFFVAYYNHFGDQLASISWSLAIEEHFYLFIPLLVRNVSRNTLIAICLIVVVVSPILRSFHDGISPYVLSYCRGDALLIGVLLAVFSSYPMASDVYFRYRYIVYALFVIMSIVTLVLLPVYARTKGGVLNHSLFAFYYALIVLLAYYSKNAIITSFLAQKTLVWLGTRSYAIYLIHLGILSYFNLNTLSYSVITSFIWFVPLMALIVTLLLAELSYRYYESKFIQWGKRYEYK